jgi:hypothetical protein
MPFIAPGYPPAIQWLQLKVRQLGTLGSKYGCVGWDGRSTAYPNAGRHPTGSVNDRT